MPFYENLILLFLCLIVHKTHYFSTYFTLLQHLSPQFGSNMPISMKPLLLKYEMCCDWLAGPV